MKQQIPVLHLENFTQKEIHAPFYVNHLSTHLKENHALISHPHKHDFYLTVFFLRGNGTHQIDFQDYMVQAGSVFLLKPGQTHYWELSSDSEGYIFFHDELKNQSLHDFPFYSFLSNSPEILLKKEVLANFKTNLQNLHEEFQLNSTFKERKLTNIIDTIYIDLSRIYEQNKATPSIVASGVYLQQLFLLEKLIEIHYKTEKSPSQYAEWMHISAKHLNRIVRESLHKTTSDLISERIILEAKRLLSHAHLSLSEISFELGFEEYAYFSRFFKKGTGETLSEFRKRYGK